MRASLLFLLLLVAAMDAGAQDRIYTTTGEVIQAHVQAASIFRVRYTEFEGGDKTAHTIPGNEVERIVYQSGRTWQPKPSRHERRPLAPLPAAEDMPHEDEQRGKNILLAVPTQLFLAGYAAYAIGLDYERLLGADNKVGIHIPIMAGLQPDIFENTKATFVYTTPGLRFHPIPAGRIDFCAGPSLLLGSVRLDEYDQSTGTRAAASHFISGLLMESELHVQREGAFMFAVHASTGYLFQSLSDSRFVLELGIRIGARF